MKQCSTLGDRMKRYENDTNNMVQVNECMVVRLDGHKFSTFTKGFDKPFDTRLSHAMIETTKDLVKKFSACTGYTQSDEITLVFPVLTEKCTEFIHKGRTQKIASSCAAYCSVRFAHHLSKCNFNENKDLQKKVMRFETYFDGRVIALPNKTEVVNNLIWRSKYDCVRNSISSLGKFHFGTNKCTNKNGTELKEMLISLSKETDKKDCSWESQPDYFKYGIFVKKQLYEVDATNPKTGKKLTTTRSRLVTVSIPDLCCEPTKFIFSKYHV